MATFASIDFETANHKGHSACAVAIVTVEDHVVTDRYYTLIQPPGNFYFEGFCKIHGIYPQHTLDSPLFEDVYSEIMNRLEDKTIVAHAEGFDRNVLNACLQYYDLSPRSLKLNKPWRCTVKIYRKKGFKPCSLDACCRVLDIPLNHHNALSDAEACAELFSRHLQKICEW